MDKIALTVENLTKIYSKNKKKQTLERALNNLSFEVKRGEIFGLYLELRIDQPATLVIFLE